MADPASGAGCDVLDANDGNESNVLAEVRQSLSRTPRELPSKFFYDERGSRLFEEITRLPEYYLTRAEREILERQAPTIVGQVRPRTLVELGAGSAEKTRLLLTAMQMQQEQPTYVPVDVSSAFLEDTRKSLVAEYPTLRVVPLVADIDDTLALPASLGRPMLFAFLGSTIGNFDEARARALLGRIREQMRAGDALLLGTDLRKDPAVLNAAYNDGAGVTAEFNLNMLRALNARLGADFNPDRFRHRAFYNEVAHRIEMHLESWGDQVVRIPGMHDVELRDGESIRTELSHKYDRASVNAMAESAGLTVAHWFTDSEYRFALSLLEPTP